MSIRSRVDKQLRRFEKPYETLNEITLSQAALLNNFDFFASLVPAGNVIPVLKSNAYGHGIAEVATILRQREFPYIAVDGYYESLTVRNASKQAVLVMGAIQPANFKNISFTGLTFAIHDIATVQAFAKTGRKVKVHIELETGMARHGVTTKDLPDFLKLLSIYPKIEVEGVMTHLADADNYSNDSYNNKQADTFDNAVRIILEAGFRPKYFHIAQSAGSFKIHSKYANCLRIGIALYGVNPLNPKDSTHEQLNKLAPVAELTSTITKINTIDPGLTVSYGRTYAAKQKTHIGVLPLGYYEGLPRELSNSGYVQHKDTYFSIVGRVCMNHTMINLGDSKAAIGDKVTIFSRDKTSKNSIDNICQEHALFNYGLLVGLNQSIRRKIV